MADGPDNSGMVTRVSGIELGVLALLLLVGFGFSYFLASFLHGEALQFIDKANHVVANGQVTAVDFDRARFNAAYDFAAASLSTREWMRGVGAALSIWLCLIGSIYVILKYRSDVTAELAGVSPGMSAKLASSSIGLVIIAFGVGLFVAVAYWRPDVTFDPRPAYATSIPASATASSAPAPSSAATPAASEPIDLNTMLRMVDPKKCQQCLTDKEGDADACTAAKLCEVAPAGPAFAQ
jgi:hypothetical protein